MYVIRIKIKFMKFDFNPVPFDPERISPSGEAYAEAHFAGCEVRASNEKGTA